jgi:hypothetical protein
MFKKTHEVPRSSRQSFGTYSTHAGSTTSGPVDAFSEPLYVAEYEPQTMQNMCAVLISTQFLRLSKR